jgi:serine/threonine protein kinase
MTDPTPPEPTRDEPEDRSVDPAASEDGLAGDPQPTLPYLPAHDPQPTPTYWPPPDDITGPPLTSDPSVPVTIDPEALPRAGFPPRRIPGYELLDVVGYGGLSAVYRARHRELGLEVAVKVIYGAFSRFARDPKLRAVLHRLGRLRHPNLVSTYGHGVQDEFPFLVMEYIDGTSLHHVGTTGGPTDFREAARLLEEVARGVSYLHAEGILHRDVKPSNILVEASVDGLAGRVRLTDYGLAMLWPTPWEDEPDGPGAVVGTPAFMAPEQALGQLEAFGPGLDIWALGATFFWLLTGQHPFRRTSMFEMLTAIIHEEAPSPRSLRPDVPADLEAICARCLRREPAKRYPDAAALADDLRRFQAGEPVAPRRRKPWWAFWRSE